MLPAHWEGGARATQYLSASRSKNLDSREGGAEGGFKGGIPRRPSGLATCRAERGINGGSVEKRFELGCIGTSRFKKARIIFWPF